MKIGIGYLGESLDRLTRTHLLDGARAAEAAGFDGLWYFDAIGRGHIHPDPLIALTLAASVTKDLEVGTCILQVPLRQTVALARAALTAHLFCEGRFSFGVGAGSTKTDFDFSGLNFDTRLKDLSAALPLMQKIWRDETVNGARIDAWPAAKGGPPVLIGSWAGKAWIPRAASEFDGWIASGARSTFNKLKDGIANYRAHGGKRAIVTNIKVDLTAPTEAMPDDGPFHLCCDLKTAQQRFRRIVDLGYDEAIFVVPDHRAETLDRVLAITGK
ncbi:MAG: LLM class flavin-dependent oxidoreductase [Alphaproteobacteria bacterium]|nr:LLM class flavin-dependent oxidoreductase [Alphaproteobacteria bacterium]MCB9927925.1 LLM class flavin-dependent oxidoreductase [Alphaproteobacteria bacterium]